jgi:hypothetical protein
MRELRPRLDGLREQAHRHWRALQRPVELMPGVLLLANPLAVGLAPPRGSGHSMHTVLGVALEPRIVLGESAPSLEQKEVRPVPPLRTFVPRGEALRFDLALGLDLADLSERLSRRLGGERLQVADYSIGIESMELEGEGSEVLIRVRLTGDAAGSTRIWAEPRFDPKRQSVQLEGLEFVYDGEDSDKAQVANLFYERIRAALKKVANDLLAERIESLANGLKTALSKTLPPEMEVDLSRLRLDRLDLSLTNSRLSASGTVSGALSVRVR